MSMPVHYTNTRESEPTSVAAMVRKNLGLERDDHPDDYATWRDAADECQGRLSGLRERGEDDEEEDSTPTPEELESVCRPLHHYLAKMRHAGESTREDDDLRREPSEGENGRRGDYLSEGETVRGSRGSSGEFRGRVVSHVTTK